MYSRLFSPLRIGSLEVKNRIVMPAIHMMYNMDGYANQKFNEFYWRRAEGGAGLIFVGGCRFDEYGGSPGMMSLETDDFIPGYREFTDGMHKRGAKVGVQLYHAGAYAHQIANEGREALAPSAILSKFTKEMPKEATVEEIRGIIEKWAAAAVRAKSAGFDIVEISASAGYLICQFLSPKTNHRTDEYGGSWENRTRFARETLSAVRAAVGSNFPICVRIAGNDFVPGSNTGEQAILFARLLEEWGVDMINVTGGWHETVIPQLTGDVPAGGFTYLARAVKETISIPVAASNRLGDPEVAERLLATEEVDLISVGRPLIADPDLPNKANSGRPELIRRCLACNQGCLAKTFFAQPAGCIINPRAGHEYEKEERSCTGVKNILVVGAGPGGCEFAVCAAQAGHRVTIWEKNSCIGGQLVYAAAPPSKRNFKNLEDYYVAMLSELGVKIVLSENATADKVVKAGFDLVVCATGSHPKKISLPGTSEQSVCTAEDILSGAKIAGKDVVVIGGGAVGLETAHYLALEGALTPEQVYFLMSRGAETPEKVRELMDKAGHKVTVLDMAKIGGGFEPGTAWPLLQELDRFGVSRYPFAKVLDVTPNTLSFEAEVQKTREQKARERQTGIAEPSKIVNETIPCDTVVMAVGGEPDNSLYEELKLRGIAAHSIGDCTAVGKISDALEMAHTMAKGVL